MTHEHQFLCTKTAPIVRTRHGLLRGFLYDNVYNFWGVDYARAHRFEQPEDIPSWEGVKDALAYGYVSPLLGDPIPDNELTVPHRFWPEGEACLNLNIATPSIDPEAKKPVMVWFHGGGYSDGSGIAHIAFEGDNMARYQDVVMVCVNHRLNAFGFLDLSDYGEKFKNSGNAGIADLVTALQWVKENIAAFGGDPDNVTIFGQSGGGGKVITLGQTAAADGLYQKAIIMSGVFAKRSVEGYPTPTNKELIREILRQLNLTENDIDKLQKINFRLFIMAVNRALVTFGKKGMVVNWGPHKNYWYEGTPMDDGFREHFRKIPTMIGSTIGEFGNPYTEKHKSEMTEKERLQCVKEAFGEESDKVLAMYREAYPEKNIAYLPFLDNMVRLGSMQFAMEKSKGEHAPVYSYLLGSTFEMDNGMPAWHNCDIPYAFANADRIQYCCSTENWRELAEVIPAAFAAFARTGDPNVEGMPAWTPATDTQVPTMIWDARCEVKTNHDLELVEYLHAHAKPAVFAWRLPKDEEDTGHEWKY